MSPITDHQSPVTDHLVTGHRVTLITGPVTGHPVTGYRSSRHRLPVTGSLINGRWLPRHRIIGSPREHLRPLPSVPPRLWQCDTEVTRSQSQATCHLCDIHSHVWCCGGPSPMCGAAVGRHQCVVPQSAVTSVWCRSRPSPVWCCGRPGHQCVVPQSAVTSVVL